MFNTKIPLNAYNFDLNIHIFYLFFLEWNHSDINFYFFFFIFYFYWAYIPIMDSCEW